MHKKYFISAVIAIIILTFIPTTSYSVFTNPKTTNSNYNRYDAYNYITKYVITPNPEYADFTDYGGDCTNFVSQVLRAGKMSFTEISLNPTYRQWYYYNSNYGTGRSSTWTGAQEFRQHWADVNGIGLKRAYKFTKYTVDEALVNFDSIRNSVWTGDIIQHLYGPDGRTYHSQVVYSFQEDDIIVGQHTYNMLRSLKIYLQAKQEAGYGSDGVCVINIKYGS